MGEAMKAIGRYQPLSLLGKGGMAEVYLAEAQGPQGFKKRLALKLMQTALINDAKMVQLFLREARVAAQFSHPNIIQVYDFGEIEGRYFIAMEYAEGVTLRDLFRRVRDAKGKLPEVVIVAAAIQIAGALAYMQDLKSPDGRPLNVIHRDISPDNVFITRDGFAKLIDFGVARADHDVEADSTKAGEIKGKPSYMSPEQVQGLPLDGRTDIYSLGVVLWECLAGKRLRQGSLVEVLGQVLQQKVPDLLQVSPELSPDVAATVMKMVAREVKDRPMAADLQRSLEHLLFNKRVSNPQVALQAFMKDPEKASGLQAIPAEMGGLPLSFAGADELGPSSVVSQAMTGTGGREASISQVQREAARIAPMTKDKQQHNELELQAPESGYQRMELAFDVRAARVAADDEAAAAREEEANDEPGLALAFDPHQQRTPQEDPQSVVLLRPSPQGKAPSSVPKGARPGSVGGVRAASAGGLKAAPTPAPRAAPASMELEFDPSARARPSTGGNPRAQARPSTGSGNAQPSQARPNPGGTKAASRAAADPGHARNIAIGVGVLALLAAVGLSWKATHPAAEVPQVSDAPKPRDLGLAEVRIDSEPPGAKVTIDGRAKGQRTPLTVDLLEDVEHEVNIELADHVTYFTKYRGRGSDHHIAATLPLRTTVHLTVTPTDAQVKLGGKEVGNRSPVDIQVDSGGKSARLDVLKEGYLPFHLERAFPTGVTPLDVQLKPIALIAVETQPAGAAIWVDEADTGLVTPQARLQVEAGQAHVLKVTLDGFKLQTKPLTGMKPGEPTKVSFKLVRGPGKSK